jgi:hypothetical protein
MPHRLSRRPSARRGCEDATDLGLIANTTFTRRMRPAVRDVEVGS